MNFLRRKTKAHSKLGKGRKKKQKWRNPTGRDNKMREKRKGYPVVVSIGYKKAETARGLLKNKVPVLVKNLGDLKKLSQGEIAIIGRIGKKNKIKIVKKAKEMKIEIQNLNITKFLKNLGKKENESK